MSESVRNPQQQRSIDKKNRIIRAGYELFAEKGYFNTNTAEIAKRAGVSTGIVYGYFHDKRDVLIEALDLYTELNLSPVITMIDELSAPLDFEKLLYRFIDEVVEIHSQNSGIHQALHSLSSYDSAVNAKFMEFEAKLTDRICEKLRALGYNFVGLTEKVHLATELIQSYAHECVFDRHDYIDYAVMRDTAVKLLAQLFV